MKRAILMLCFLLFPLAGSAAEIVAWKVPLARYGWEGLEAEGVVRRDAAPEASLFFKEGDELWDLTGIEVENSAGAKVTPEWVVWNAGTGRLVAKGDWAQITAIHERLRMDQMARHCRVTFRLISVEDASEVPSHDRKPVAEVSLVSKSGQKAEASWSGEGFDVSVETEVTIGESDQIVDLRLVWQSKSADQPGFKVNTALTIFSGEPVWVARDFDGHQGFDLMASATLETLDGPPLARRMLIQKGKRVESLMPPPGFSPGKTEAIGDSGWLVRIALPPMIVSQLAAPDSRDNQADPFAEPDPSVRYFIPVTGSVKPPGVLKSVLDHEVLDARKWLEESGIVVKDGEFLGYDPLREMLYFYSPNPTSLDMLQALFSTICWDGPTHVFVTLDGNGQSRLISRSGQMASLARMDGDNKVVRSLDIEPTLGETGDMVDLRFAFDDNGDPGTACKVNSMATLQVGEWLEVAAGSFGDAERTPVRVKAEVDRSAP